MVPAPLRPLPRRTVPARVLVGLVVGLIAASSVAGCSSDDADDSSGAAGPATDGTTPGAGPETQTYCEVVDQLLGVLEPTRLAEPVDPGEPDEPGEPGEGADPGEATEPLVELARVAAYDRLVAQVRELAPAEHARAWELLAAVSEVPFSYERFNPAVDELERIDDDLEARCPDLGRFVVNDDGRLTRW